MSARTDLCGGTGQLVSLPHPRSTLREQRPRPANHVAGEVESIMLPKGQNWILMLALLLAVPVMRSPITVPRSQSRDDRETRARCQDKSDTIISGALRRLTLAAQNLTNMLFIGIKCGTRISGSQR